ncbi:MAG: hypothetical protein ACI8UQ_002106 [Bacteroidia bacterium]|jgi:hypothetical protein
MKSTKIFLLLSVIVLLASCSQYAHRTVRVKKSKHTEDAVAKQNFTLKKDLGIASNTLEVAMQGEDLPKPFIRHRIKPLKVSEVRQAIRQSVPGRAYLRIKSDSVVHDSVSIGDLDREEIIQKYERANGLSIAALILLLTSPFTFGLGFLLSLVFAIIAIRIYFKYKNPGVKERYVMALSVIVGAFVLLGAFIGLILFIFAY